MTSLQYTLLTDGSSDRALLPILTWILRQYLPYHAINAEWADFRRLHVRPRTLTDRIVTAIDLYPCDLLFVHRDAERSSFDQRHDEIVRAVDHAADRSSLPNCQAVIPVRMQEAWLLIDVAAIRQAAGNPAGRARLSLPAISQLEKMPNPKDTLYGLLRTASDLRGRRLQRFRVSQAAQRVAREIADFRPLMRLSAFRRLADDVSSFAADRNSS